MLKAQPFLEQAIVIGDKSLQTVAGSCRGSLAIVVAAQGELERARRLLKVGEEQLRGAYPLQLGKLLCRRGTVEHNAGRRDLAQAALAEARAIAEAQGVGADSNLHKMIAVLQVLLG